jgi:hypothetical protein
MIGDLRYAIRVLLKNRGFALAAILTIALGVGVNTSIFSIADGMLFRPLPYAHPETLVALQEQNAKGQTFGTMPLEMFEALQAGSSVEALGYISRDGTSPT